MTLFGIRIRFHILSPLIILLFSVFSGIEEAFFVLAALSVHELSHLLAAFFLHARVDEIELMPYGAAIRLYGLWETHPMKLFLISLAGPAANLILSAILALLTVVFPKALPLFHHFIRFSLTLALVNLIPALPLDGGRCLCTLLSLRFKRASCVKFGVIMGYVFSFALLSLGIYSFVRYATLPLFPLLASVYIISSGAQEKRQAEGAALRGKLLNHPPYPPVGRAVLVLADADTPVYEAEKQVFAGERALFAVTDKNGKVTSVLSDRQIRHSLLENASKCLGHIK